MSNWADNIFIKTKFFFLLLFLFLLILLILGRLRWWTYYLGYIIDNVKIVIYHSTIALKPLWRTKHLRSSHWILVSIRKIQRKIYLLKLSKILLGRHLEIKNNRWFHHLEECSHLLKLWCRDSFFITSKVKIRAKLGQEKTYYLVVDWLMKGWEDLLDLKLNRRMRIML